MKQKKKQLKKLKITDEEMKKKFFEVLLSKAVLNGMNGCGDGCNHKEDEIKEMKSYHYEVGYIG